MPDAQALAGILRDAIRDGTFPNSDELLTLELSTDNIPAISESISKARQDLGDEIAAESKNEAQDVDGWIQQAQKIQEDIARCKIEAKQIVNDHKRVQESKRITLDADAKVGLLEKEILFTEALQKELDQVSLIYRSFRNVDSLLQQGDTIQASKELQSLRDPFSRTSASAAKSLCYDIEKELRTKIRTQLENDLNRKIIFGEEENINWLEVKIYDNSDNSQIEAMIGSLLQLGFLQDVIEAITEKIEKFVLPALHKQSTLKISSHSIDSNRITVHFSSKESSLGDTMSFAKDILTYLHTMLPTSLHTIIAKRISPKLVSVVITDWLNPSVPSDLSELASLENLQKQASSLAEQIRSLEWQGYEDLTDWTNQAPKIWLMRRKAHTLDIVRKTLLMSHGTIRQVERIEKQMISFDKVSEREEASDDWNADWDGDGEDDADDTKAGEAQDDETSGWGFDDDDNTSNDDNAVTKRPGLNGSSTQEHLNSEDEPAESWGWGDDTETEQKDKTVEEKSSSKVNGTAARSKGKQEVILKELYSVTDIPDHLMEVISADVQDAELVRQGNYSSLKNIPAASGLLALPTFALAMFRATAPTHYSSSGILSNMNLYNDSLYVVEKLRDTNLSGKMQNLDNDCKIMEKFARSAYAREMEIQRTILNDLLDGAQGFTGSTKFPYSQEIENAIEGTVDRVRTIHKEWQPILSTSALLQSIGGLVSMVISKIINDIEEMEDISEPESHRLNDYCSRINSLEDLFVSKAPGLSADDAESVPMTAVYVSNWLRFQYLSNILESSLVDIKFLWTEGELSLEFTQDEVIDLIKALFADSPHRRSSISAIRGYRSSGS